MRERTSLPTVVFRLRRRMLTIYCLPRLRGQGRQDLVREGPEIVHDGMEQQRTRDSTVNQEKLSRHGGFLARAAAVG